MFLSERHKGAIELAQKSAIRLSLDSDSICTACNYLHRFYRFLDQAKKPSESQIEETAYYDTGLVVSTCLYLGEHLG